MIRNVAARLMPVLTIPKPLDRRHEYAALLWRARATGYSGIPVSAFFDLVEGGADAGGGQILALRHDVDRTNDRGNELLFEIEQSAQMLSTYYFRLSTAPAHRKLITRMLEAGFEVGYHFEEAASVAKRYRLTDRDAVLARRDEIAELFIANCATFRRNWNPGLVTVSSHGDWINRKLQVTNREVIDDATLAAAGVRFEAYDRRLMDGAAVYVSDVARWPSLWANDRSLTDALAEGLSPIYFLSHEYNWHSDLSANLRHLMQRVSEGARYKLPSVRT